MNLWIRSALASALLFAGQASAAEEKATEFVHAASGFSVTTPAGWHVLSEADGEGEQQLKSLKLGSAEQRASLAQYATVPLYAVTKHPEPYNDVNPSFKVNIKPFDELKGKSGVEILVMLVPSIASLLKDFQIAEAPSEVEVAGVKSGHVRILYTLEAGGHRFPTSSEMWIVPHGDHFFMIGAGTRQDEKNGTRAEIQAILDSVRIASP
jgi:hypothetical protein